VVVQKPSLLIQQRHMLRTFQLKVNNGHHFCTASDAEPCAIRDDKKGTVKKKFLANIFMCAEEEELK
jgi:hypothetical protein